MSLFTSCLNSLHPNHSKMASSPITLSKNTKHLHSPDGKTVDFAKLNGHLKLVAHKYQRCLSAYESNVGKKHPRHHAGEGGSMLIKGAGDVSLEDEQNELWTGPISFGGQTFKIDFDTGAWHVSRRARGASLLPLTSPLLLLV